MEENVSISIFFVKVRLFFDLLQVRDSRRVGLSDLLGWSGRMSELPALGELHQEAPSTPPSAAVLLQKGIRS